MKSPVSVFIATHLVDASTAHPLVENWMLERTIRSFQNHLLGTCCTVRIFCDCRIANVHPEPFSRYIAFIDQLVQNFRQTGLDIERVTHTGHSLRANWELFLQACNTPYLLFLEHDWELVAPVDLGDIIKAFDRHPAINYLKLTHQGMPLTPGLYRQLATNDNWNWLMEEEPGLTVPFPLTRVSFVSGNPHFQRVSFFRDFVLAWLTEDCPSSQALGSSHWEKDIQQITKRHIDQYRNCGAGEPGEAGAWGHQWPLSSPGRPGNGCLECRNALRRQQEHWGTFLYGASGMDALIVHNGIWCRKR